jgi:curli biogenesis system outer membrane secretion channel CsgG
MLRTALSCALAASAGLILANSTVSAQTAQEQRAQKTAQIPRCAQPLGVLAVEQPQRDWWTELKLGSPEALLRVFVQQSNCFTQVDRGAGLAAAQRERALASGGALQQGSNVGGGQIQAADYVLLPDLVTQNANARGNNFGAALGGLLGRNNPVLGGIVGGLNINSSTADVTLAITDVRSTRQLAVIDGHGEKRDIGFGVGGGLFGGSGFGSAGATGYNNTEIGQVITLAYLDAFTKLVDQLGGLPVEGASAANAQQAVVVNRPSRMYSQPSTQSTLVRPLDIGARLYPTGNKNGLMWEVKDDLGNTGWVSSITFDLAR